jgi:hypothetical protein
LVGELGFLTSVDAEGGDEVFVEFEPDAVAGVDVGAVDEGALAGLCPRSRGGEALVVAAEAREQLLQCPGSGPTQWPGCTGRTGRR